MRSLIKQVLILLGIRLVLMTVVFFIVIIFVTGPNKDVLSEDELSRISLEAFSLLACSCCCLCYYCGSVIGCYYKLYLDEKDVEFCRHQVK